MAYCTSCGKEIDDSAIVCPYCAAPTENWEAPQAAAPAPTKSGANTLGIISIVMGALGLFWALLLALFGYLFGGAGLTLALIGHSKEKANGKCKVGLWLSIGALALSVLSSIIGVLLVL